MADFSGISLAESPWFQSWPLVMPLPPSEASLALASGSLGPAIHVPGEVPLPHTNHGAVAAGSHLNLIMEKILVKPPVISVGTILQTRQFEGLIWNTFRETPAVLESIAAAGDNAGIFIQGIEDDDVIAPRRDRVITYEVTRTGPLTIEVTFQFAFDIGDGFQRLTGSRGIVLTIRPLSSGYVESVGFATDIGESDDGTEYRATEMPNGGPTRRATFPFQARTREQVTALQMALQFGARFTIFVPLWGSQMELTGPVEGSTILPVDTTLADFANITSVMAIERHGDTFEVRSILATDPAFIEVADPVSGFIAGDLIVPLVQMTPDRETQVRYTSERRAVGSIEFEEVR